jgi:hypothetical protein
LTFDAPRETSPRMTDTAIATDTRAANTTLKRVLTAAWLAVIAGVLAQMAIVAIRAWAGGTAQFGGIVAEFAQGVSWSVFVCGAIAIGTLASKSRAHIAGLIGLFAGPLAWAAAKGVQKGVQALAGAPQDQLTPLFWSVCAWKGIEYALLGYGLATIVGQKHAKLGSYITLGLLIGLLSACVVIALNVGNAAAAGGPHVPFPRIATLLTNEVLFATACSIVIYTAQVLTRSLSALKTV